MGLVNKLKNILFEEEEVEIPVLEKKEKKVVSEPVIREMPRKEEPRQASDYSNFYNDVTEAKPLPKKENIEETSVRAREEIKTNLDTVSEREMFKSDKTFNFPSFDEEEFENSALRRPTNVMEHERRKTKERENVKKQQVVKKEEVKEVKTKFRPSPIISPVYGILDKNYTPEDITTREVVPKVLDVDSVRKKAFGTLEEEIMDIETPNYSEIDEAEDKFLEEKLEKARTIDELLKDSSDDVIEVTDNNYGEKKYNNEYANINLEDTFDVPQKVSETKNDLDATIDSLEEDLNAKPQVGVSEEDTLESDLFDLIDSMYENREDGE